MKQNSDPHAEPESQWMSDVARGDREAFRRIVQKYQQPILNLAYRFTGDKDFSQDLAQDIFLKVYLSAPRYRPEAKFTTWLYRVGVNHCLNHLRDHARSEHRLGTFKDTRALVDDSYSSSLASESPSVEGLILEQEKALGVRRAIQGLPPRQRMAVVLQRYHGLRYGEIAQVMECSVGAVESLLVRALDQLREALKDVYEGPKDAD